MLHSKLPRFALALLASSAGLALAAGAEAQTAPRATGTQCAVRKT